MENQPSERQRPRNSARGCKFPDIAYKVDIAYRKWSCHWFAEVWILVALRWSMVVLLILLQIGVVVIGIIMILKTHSSTDEASNDFALYKNSRFKECVNATPERVICTLLQGNLLGTGKDHTLQAQQNHFLMVLSFADYTWGDFDRRPTYTWCEMASCFKDYKQIPTTLRPSSLQLSNLKLWFQLNLAAILGAWTTRSWIGKQPRQAPSACKGIGFLDWAPAVYTIGATLYWWAEFFRWCTRPDYYAVVSVIAWIPVWSLAYKVRYHPFSCKFNKDSTYKKILSWVLWTIATIQCIISCELLRRNWGDFSVPRLDFAQRYDCIKSRIAAAPGSSACAAEKLCSIPWLLSNPGWTGDGETEIFNFPTFGPVKAIFLFTFFVSLFGFFSTPFAVAIRRSYTFFHPHKRIKRTILDDLAYFDDTYGSGPIIVAALAAFGTLCTGAAMIGYTPSLWNFMNREGTIAYDLECTAVHVIVSPWRQYMDIEYGRVLRMVQMWFNV